VAIAWVVVGPALLLPLAGAAVVVPVVAVAATAATAVEAATVGVPVEVLPQAERAAAPAMPARLPRMDLRLTARAINAEACG